MSCFLYSKGIKITDYIEIRVPNVGEIIENEEAFNNVVSYVVSTPYELMVPLDDAGIDFTTITPFDVFIMLFGNLKNADTSVLFGSTDFSGYRHAIDESTNESVLIDERTGNKIDRVVHDMMCKTIRKLLHLTVNDKKPGNEEARRYMLDKARRKMKRNRRRKKDDESPLEKYIIALVNTEQFKYDYCTVKDISIYQFYSSLKQITHKIRFDNTMYGYYSGSIKFDDISQEDKSWILTTNT